MEDLTWKNRVVIVQTSDNYSQKWLDQLEEFSHSQNELVERKLALFKIHQEEYTCIDFARSDSTYSGDTDELFYKSVLAQSKDFEVILIGLDGGVKLRQEDVLSQKKLFQIIDAMPMRRSEMKEN